jgi:hypothetical protein
MKKLLPLVMMVLLPSIVWAQGTLNVSAVYGDVELRPSAARAFGPLSQSVRQVQVGDEIRTGPGSTVTLELPDSSYMVVHENSTLVVQDFWSSSLRGIVNLMVGKIRFYINTLGGRPNPYRVGTPTALIAVRGTIFDVFVDEAQFTEVWCLEGRVAVESAGLSDREVILDAGRKTLVRPGEYPLAPVNLDDALARNRVIRLVQTAPSEAEARGKNSPNIEALIRDNDRRIRTVDPLRNPSQTDSNIQRGKPTLNYPE